MRVAERLGLGEHGRYMAAFTFGNVHGAYKPGIVKLRPRLLHDIQTEVWNAAHDGRLGSAESAHVASCALPDMPEGKPFPLVFHGGSGSTAAEIAEAVSYGVVKMNIDTDTQYAFSRAIAGHMFRNYDSVLKIDAKSATRSCTTRVPGAAKPKRRWPRAWSRRASSSAPPVAR